MYLAGVLYTVSQIDNKPVRVRRWCSVFSRFSAGPSTGGGLRWGGGGWSWRITGETGDILVPCTTTLLQPEIPHRSSVVPLITGERLRVETRAEAALASDHRCLALRRPCCFTSNMSTVASTYYYYYYIISDHMTYSH